MKLRLLVFVSCLLAATLPAKLAPDRWTRLTEEERHQLTRAERYVEQKNWKSARSEYELFLQLHTKSETASYAQLMFAECTRQLGQINTAINEFRNVIDYFPDAIDAGHAQYSIGVCQTQTGDAEEAVKAFEKVIAKWPTNDFGAFARSEVCKIYWRLGKPEKWSPHMEYLATGDYIDPQNLHAASQHRYLMHLLMSGKTADGYALVDKVRKKDALVTFASWTADAMHNHHIPTFYGEKGTKARGTVAADAVAFIEKQPTADAAQKASLEHWCARIFAYAGETAKATERFAALTKKNPDSDEIRGEYAAYLRTSGKRGEARLVYRELKDQYVADREIAETYGEENNWKSCVEAYQAMLTKHPKQSDAIQWRLGEVLNRIGKYQEALEEVRSRQAVHAQRLADVEIARQQIKETVIVAPFDGAIQERRASAGEFLAVSDPIVTLVRMDPLRLRVEVPERDSVELKPGQKVRLSIAGVPADRKSTRLNSSH